MSLMRNGNEIDKWISTKEVHHVNGLEEGKTYTLTEITCPYGYEKAESITFSVGKDKDTQIIEMKDKPILKTIRIIKKDSETLERILGSFTFGLYKDEECTQLIQQMDSNKKDGTVTFEDIRYGKYYIKEINPPKGYVLTENLIELEINDKGVFANEEKIEEDNFVYSFDFYNDRIPEIYTGITIKKAVLIGIMIISMILSIAMIVYIKKMKK